MLLLAPTFAAPLRFHYAHNMAEPPGEADRMYRLLRSTMRQPLWPESYRVRTGR
jgi:hypothetical protein